MLEAAHARRHRHADRALPPLPHEDGAPVGWFKENLTFPCDGCPATLRYDRDLLRLDIETGGHMPAGIAGAVTVVDDDA